MFFAKLFLINAYELTRPKVDILSVILSIFGFGGIVLGAGMTSEYGWTSWTVILSLVVGVVCIVFYSIRQFSMSNPVLNLRAFNSRDFALGTSLVVLNFGIMLAIMYLLPQFFQNSMAIAVTISGTLLLPGGVVNTITAMLSGRFYNKLGVRVLAIAGFRLSTLGICLLIWQTFVVTNGADASIVLVIIGHVLTMLGIPLAMSPLQTYTLSTLPHELNSDGSTIMNTLQQVVGAVFTALATSLLVLGQNAAAVSSTSSQTAESAIRFGQGTRWGLYLALFIALLGIFGSLFTRDTRKTNLSETSEGQNAQKQGESDEPVLRSLMKSDVYTIPSDATAMEAIEFLTKHGISGAPIVDENGHLVGFVSDGDILSLLADQIPEFTSFYSAIIEHNNESFSERVRDNMARPVLDFATRNVIVVDVNDSMSHVCEVLVSKHLKKVPVVNTADGKENKERQELVGILNRSDALGYVVEHY